MTGWQKVVHLGCIGFAGIACMLSPCVRLRDARAQFPEERRRGDLTPLTLPGGSRVEFAAFDSQTLGSQELFSVFLPPSFDKEPQRTYPVVYFLHGLNNDQTSWTVDRYGSLQKTVEELILAKKIPEIVMLHPRGDNSFYCNFLDGSRRYEDLVAQEVISYAETHYRAKKGRENRSLAGTSMGGFGALKIAMKHSDRFATVVGHSPIIFLGKNPLDVPEEMKASRYYQFFSGTLRTLFGDPIRQDLWDANNPLLLAKSGKLDGLNLYFDYGTEDRYNASIHLDQGVKALDKVLTEAGVAHTFKVWPGEGHGWSLVDAHIQESLPFLCQTFK
jgi:S-formylglutathione hydrolase FrmB